MKKFPVITALLSVLIFMLCGCETVPSFSGKSEVSEIMIPLSQPDLEFSIPQSFSETSTENNNKAYIFNNASIIINEDKLNEAVPNLTEYVKYSKELYRSATDKYTQISEEETTVNGLDAVITEFVYEINGESDILSMQCIVGFLYDASENPEKVYIVTCKSDSESYPNYKQGFLNTINSVKLK
ncbi:MAG: hypothetical protein K2G63_00945 [Oscillospiraceae bacterium]|nr:hypothetical protein [Oscillospiraceae bacterium]